MSYTHFLLPAVFIGMLSFPAFPTDSLPVPRKLMEPEKIELLIVHIQTMQDARFIRNGKEYTAVQAARHLLKKWSHVKKRITTADQFIEYIASKSSVSGNPYQIRMADGKVVTSEAVLRKKLAEIEASPPGTPDTLLPVQSR
jgi:hypothetical protein